MVCVHYVLSFVAICRKYLKQICCPLSLGSINWGHTQTSSAISHTQYRYMGMKLSTEQTQYRMCFQNSDNDVIE